MFVTPGLGLVLRQQKRKCSKQSKWPENHTPAANLRETPASGWQWRERHVRDRSCPWLPILIGARGRNRIRIDRCRRRRIDVCDSSRRSTAKGAV